MKTDYRRFWAFLKEGWKKRRTFIGPHPGQWPGWLAFLGSCRFMARQSVNPPAGQPRGFLPVFDPKWVNFCYQAPVINLGKARHERRPYRRSTSDIRQEGIESQRGAGRTPAP